jgi:hypothetical protein
MRLLIKGQQFLLSDQLALKALIFGVTSVAPIYPVRFGEPRRFIDPVRYVAVQ